MKLHFTEYGYIDLVFENTFFDGENFKFFDQEWYIRGISIEFILYRAISNFIMYNNIESKITRKEILERFQIIEYEDIFKKIEKQFQKEVLDEVTIKRSEYTKKMQYDIYK